jgi:hypothetical protein
VIRCVVDGTVRLWDTDVIATAGCPLTITAQGDAPDNARMARQRDQTA